MVCVTLCVVWLEKCTRILRRQKYFLLGLFRLLVLLYLNGFSWKGLGGRQNYFTTKDFLRTFSVLLSTNLCVSFDIEQTFLPLFEGFLYGECHEVAYRQTEQPARALV
jgi:hypothetical protein